MFLLFFLYWIIFNGQLTLEIGIIGLVVAGLLYAFLCKFMDYSFKKDLQIMQYALFLFLYIFVLIWEIVKANFATIRMIFTSRYEREPVLVIFHSHLKSPMMRVILANSITLTPGTITVSLEDDTFVVHALDKDFTEGIEDSVFVSDPGLYGPYRSRQAGLRQYDGYHGHSHHRHPCHYAAGKLSGGYLHDLCHDQFPGGHCAF